MGLYMKARKTKKAKKEVQNIYEVKNKYSSAWYVRFNKNGVKVNKSFAFNPNVPNDRQAAYEDAVKWRNAEWESITHKAASIVTTTQLTLRTLLKEYLESETPKKKPSGAEIERSRINRILNDTDKFKALIDKPIAKLGKDNFSALSRHLIDVGAERKVVAGKKVDGKIPTKSKPAKPMSKDTANRYISLFSCVFNWAMKQDKYNWIEKNLAEGHHVKIERKRKAIPTSEDLDRILAESGSKYLNIALVLGFETGARRGEIMSLEWEDIELEMDLDFLP
jgi:integrase